MDKNFLEFNISAKLANEQFIRSAVASFCVPLNPSLEEINDLKTAVSEAVTNSIVHGYNYKDGVITVKVKTEDRIVEIEIIDHGVGVNSIEEAMQPFFTTRPEEERSGMGFTVMQTFMDEVTVENLLPSGLKVRMKKQITSKE